MKRKNRKIKILITGSKGFIGTHLIHACKLNNLEYFEIDRDYDENLFNSYCLECDFIVHLAGVMRPQSSSEFYEVGNDLTEKILLNIRNNKKKPPIIFASSIQASLNNDYGKSKTEIENKLINYSKENGNKVYIFRLSNVFGKWGRPNYNSVAATFCNNIAKSIPIQINDPSTVVNFIYIDDVVDSFIRVIRSNSNDYKDLFYSVSPVYPTSLRYLSDTLYFFKSSVDEGKPPVISNDFDLKLFCAFSSYLESKTIFMNIAENSDVDFNNNFNCLDYFDGKSSVNVFLRSCVILVIVKNGNVKCEILNPKSTAEFSNILGPNTCSLIPCGNVLRITPLTNETRFEFVYYGKDGCDNFS